MHDAIKDLPYGDVLIHAGDFTGRGDPERVREFNDWLGAQPHPYKIVIPGNHELTFQRGAKDSNGSFYMTPEQAQALITNATLLIDQELVIDEIKFYGSPWQPEFHNWAYNISLPARLRQIWAKIPNDTNVLITHGPPRNILDCVPKFQGNDYCGCPELRDRILELRPQLHVFGHIHEGHGVMVNEGTTHVNASICTGSYRPINKPIVYDYKKETK